MPTGWGIHWSIMRRLAAAPLREVVIDDRGRYKSYQLIIGAQHVAGLIARRSSAPNVGLMLPTAGVFPIAALGAWSAGRTIVPLNYLLRTEELAHVIRDAGLDVIVTVGPMLEFLEKSGTSLPADVPLIRLDEHNFRSVPPARLPARAGAEDTAALVYTSGTSGRPKGVMLTHANLTVNARQGAEHMNLHRGDRMLGVLPQFHSFGLTQLTLTPLLHGLPVIYTARFVPKRIVELVREHRATVMVGIPSMYNLISRVKSVGPEDVESLRLIVSGSEPLPDAVYDRFLERFGKPINEGYGMTEMSPSTHCCLCGDAKRHSVGRPVPGVEQRIVDLETGRDLGPGADGEIRLRGPNLMKGYYNLPDETAASLDERGFYRTGDIGRIDEDGSLYITGRLKEMMIVAGENVFPREIEDVLNRHAAVKDSGVIGVSDESHGEQPVAFVELDEHTPEDHESVRGELMAACRASLAPYKLPKEIRFVEQLPRSPTGKVLRRALRELIDPASV